MSMGLSEDEHGTSALLLELRFRLILFDFLMGIV